MVRGLYISASGALVAQANVDLIANNLANVSTGGFKRSLMVATASPESEQLYRIQTDPGQDPNSNVPGVGTQQRIGELTFGAQIYDTPTVFSQGELQQTGNQLDFALQGNGFFTIQTPQGVRYTRDGEFVRNAQGLLSTQDGNLVLGQGGAPITIPDGIVTSDQHGNLDANGQAIGQLQIVQFQNPNAVRPQGNAEFVDTGGAGPVADTATAVDQGMLEKSNADVVSSMIDLITNQRWFDANEKSIQTQDTANQQVIEQVGRVSQT